MVTTAYVDFTAAVRGIGARTNAAGVAVPDYTVEEDRLANLLFTEGAVTPDDAFRVAVQSGMDLTVGSGSAKRDIYAVAGDVAGQGTYLVRLDAASVIVAIAAADPSQQRIDEVWLVVADAAYDAGAVSLPRLAVRRGDPGAAAPGPDATWRAAAQLATVTVPAGASALAAGDVADTRIVAHAPSAFPPGTVIPYAGATIPSGWLRCNGQTVSRTTYARLFAVLGTTFGAGDGSTTFAVPDLRGRFPVGAGTGYPLGGVGGAETVALSIANLAAHIHGSASHSHPSAAHVHDLGSHSHSSDPHTHAVGTLAVGGGDHTHDIDARQTSLTSHDHDSAGVSAAPSDLAVDRDTGSASHSHTLSGATASTTPGSTGTADLGNSGSTTPGSTGSATPKSSGSTGSDSAHENRPPYLALHYLIRT